MFTERKQSILAVLAGAVVFAITPPAAARFHRGGYHHYHRTSRRGGHGRRGYGGGSYGGYLNGVAGVINAQGRYLINTQQAYLLREKVRAAQLVNRRRVFDEHIYEKSLRPTLNDKRFLEQQVELRRALTHPPETEIWSGKSLNDLLIHIQDLRAKGQELPDVPLHADLTQINVTTRGVGNVGLLKGPLPLNWPVALQTLSPQDRTAAQLSQVDSLLAQAKKQASGSGRVDATVLVKLEEIADDLRDRLVARVSACSFAHYTQAKNFLAQLDQAIKVLHQPDVGNYFNGKYEARGESVAELVDSMIENGLKFAPALAGEEAPYAGLFASMAQYYLGSGTDLQTQSPVRRFYQDLYQKTWMYQHPNPTLRSLGQPLPFPPR